MRSIVFLFLFAFSAPATTLAPQGHQSQCPPGMFMQYSQHYGLSCVQNTWTDPGLIGCFPSAQPGNNWFNGFPAPLYQPQVQPWWAYQGNLYYPNMYYPGPWRYPGIQQQYYPGQGQVFAAKPNVYVNSSVPEQEFSFKFSSQEKLSFLATTPALPKSLAWSGKVEQDRFEVDGIFYDYLFYDVRLPLEKMQFDAGVCTTREEAITWMMKDLTEMGHSRLSLQDFEEHWRVKIPQYPFYCIYPQYNAQLDSHMPVEISIKQSKFHRSLYILLPYEAAPTPENVISELPLPVKDPRQIRPETKVKREVDFREWGVAFLGF